MESIIRFDNVYKSYTTKYQKINVLEDFNLKIPNGEFVVIAGPSGSGKTTILNLIAGFIRPDEGRIIVDGLDIVRLNEEQICEYRNKNIGFVFQFFNLIHSFNAEENIKVPMLIAEKNKNDINQRISELLEQVGMSHRRKHYPWELSGGEQQRIAIARALANKPKIILADEPTGNLDKNSSSSILDLLADIHKKGHTIVVVSHDSKVMERATILYDIDKLLE